MKSIKFWEAAVRTPTVGVNRGVWSNMVTNKGN